MKPARLAALAVVGVALLAAISWVAGPVQVGEPRFSLNFDVSALENEPPAEEELTCEAIFEDCQETDTGSSQAASVGTLIVTILVVAGGMWLLVKVVRWLMNMVRDARLPIRMDESVDAQIREALRAASEQAASDMEAMPPGEATNAVVACWVLLEQTAERVGTGRPPSATPTEFTVALLRRHDADPAAASTLLGLYHEARFGSGDLPPSASDTAADALRKIAESLAVRRTPTGPGEAP